MLWKQAVIIAQVIKGHSLAHLRTLPYRPQIPMSWDRQHLLDLLHEAIGNRPQINECHNIAPGVFAIIQPFGIDLLSRGEPDGRLQVWLLVRSAGTDPTRLTTLQ